MGIRFYCPNGHKLNVKEFQAGRRGICPFCGARILIPTQSTRPASKSGRRQDVALPANYALDPDEVDDSSPEILPGEPPNLPGDPAGGKMLGPSTPVGTPIASGPVVAPPTAPSTLPAPQPRPLSPSPSPMPSPRPVQLAPGGAVPAPVVLAARAPGPTVTVVPATPAAVPAVQQPAPTGPPDPIAEAPEMIWYVRPPSGGQFGPAAGELMKTWLSEGRVSADSLVWREGWRDWQEAGTVFPKLRSNQIMDFLETAPVVPAAADHGYTAPAVAHRPKVKKSSDRNQIAVLVGLVLLVVVLLGVLLLVLLRPQ